MEGAEIEEEIKDKDGKNGFPRDAGNKTYPESEWHDRYGKPTSGWRDRNPKLVNNTNLQTLVSCIYSYRIHKGKGWPVLFNDSHAKFVKDVNKRIWNLAWSGQISTGWDADWEVWEWLGKQH